mgnify:FL=1|tara:strand:+ start:1303 stop:2484 length:1182 start_codon:yes stop_codon:yes gene_type:complete
MSRSEISPISGFQSTNLNSKIDNFNRLGDRILRSLGYPFVNVEVHNDQLHENISIALEYFTKFAGYTKEYLIFDSNLYQKDYGIKLDDLFTLQNSSVSGVNTFQKQKDLVTLNKDFTKRITDAETVFIATSSISSSVFSSVSGLSGILDTGIQEGDLFNEPFYTAIVTSVSGLTSSFRAQVKNNFTIQGSLTSGDEKYDGISYINSFDYDTMDYRKVVDVTDFEEGSTTGINTLFTIEQTLAQQTYFSYAMGNYGFDLISWYTLKNWLETREKMLATKRSYSFDPRTQILRMYPQPNASDSNIRFYGVVSCYVERPIRDVVKELWVYQYALALTKIVVGRVRGKYTGTNLFGGGSINAEMLNEGINEKAALEEQMMTGTPGFGDADPPLFFVG